MSRLLLAWLLAFALPLQGMAGASMLHCAVSGGAATGLPDVQEVSSRGHHRAQHHASAQAQEVAPTPSPAHHHAVIHHDTPADTSAGAGHSCSACAVCSLGSALPSTGKAVTGVPPGEAPALAPVVPAISFISSGLERPPRPALA